MQASVHARTAAVTPVLELYLKVVYFVEYLTPTQTYPIWDGAWDVSPQSSHPYAPIMLPVALLFNSVNQPAYCTCT